MPSAPGSRLRVAFVVQRYGEEVNGGAEALCRMIAERMTRHWTVDVLTTCALDYLTWQDHFAPGATELNGVTVRRFPVAEMRDIERFNRLSEALLSDASPELEAQEEWMRAQGPWSPGLLEAITTGAGRYDVVFFFGYLYAQAYFGLPRFDCPAVLVPFAHDEWAIRFDMFDTLFARAAQFVFSTPEEKRFLQRRFASAGIEGPVVGVAVERPARVDPAHFRAEHRIAEDFLLYVGRVDPSKGCGEMFDHFLRHIEATGDARSLVTIGRAVMPIPDHPRIRALGFVSEQSKWDALAACDVLVMPSPYESLSLVLLEAWAVGKPVLVNGRCEVLAGQARRAHGGLEYRDYDEFSAALDRLSAGAVPTVLGRQGFDYVHARYRWDVIEAEYLKVAEAALQRQSMIES